MFKAPIKVLHPLLTATQEGNYNGTEGFGAIPFDGVDSRALERIGMGSIQERTRTTRPSSTAIYIVKVPYCLRISEEIKIYDKLLSTPRWRTRRARPERSK